MRYLKKGDFFCVPFIDRIKGEHPITQIIYTWMCKFVGDNDTCYPSRKKLSECCGCGLRSIDTYIERLVDLGVIEKNRRFKEGEELSSEFRILYPPAGDATPPAGDADELNTLIIITDKKEIYDLLGEDLVAQYKPQLKCIWYMIELGYKLPIDRKAILDEIDWIKEKAEIYGYRMVDGGYDWNSILRQFDLWSEYHKKNKSNIDGYRNSVIRFLNPNNSFKGKQKR